MRDGTPSGFSTMSTGVPSARYGMSSSGRIREMTPLLPWRPAILSPTGSLRLMATKTLTILMTPGGSSSPSLQALDLLVEDRLDHVDRSSTFCDDALDLILRARVVDLDRRPSGAAGSASSSSSVIVVALVEPRLLAALVGDAVRGRACRRAARALLLQRALADDADLVLLVLAAGARSRLLDRAWRARPSRRPCARRRGRRSRCPRRPAARAATCRAPRRPSRRRSRAAASLRARAGSRPSA